MNPIHTKECFAAHMGVWMIENDVAHKMWMAIQDGVVQPRPVVEDVRESEYEVSNGIAVIRLDDVMMRKASKYGGVSTVAVRRQLRDAVLDVNVKQIVLWINSPGGHADGQQELLDDIRMAGNHKSIHAYISDTGCSAAYWAAAICHTISCGRMARVGSVGAFTVLYDLSKQAEVAGIKVVPVRSGPKKGLGVPGEAISEELLAQTQKMVDSYFKYFVDDVEMSIDVRTGVGSPIEGAWDTGEAFFADVAYEYGLVDFVCTFEEMMERIMETDKPSVLTAVSPQAIPGASQSTGAKPVEAAATEGAERGDPERATLLAKLTETEAKLVDAEKRAKANEDAAAQLKALQAGCSPPPSRAAGKAPELSAAATLAEYQTKYGGIEGGLRFGKEHPEMYKTLYSNN